LGSNIAWRVHDADEPLFVSVTVTGVLKGYDPLMNLVLDEVKETMRDDEGKETTRDLGLTVARGTMIVLISPVDGSEEIANPFAQTED
jgi:U6 snRNA-associated Sm-like protein LSm7